MMKPKKAATKRVLHSVTKDGRIIIIGNPFDSPEPQQVAWQNHVVSLLQGNCGADITLIPNPQERCPWRTESIFKFKEDNDPRYAL